MILFVFFHFRCCSSKAYLYLFIHLLLLNCIYMIDCKMKYDKRMGAWYPLSFHYICEYAHILLSYLKHLFCVVLWKPFENTLTKCYFYRKQNIARQKTSIKFWYQAIACLVALQMYEHRYIRLYWCCLCCRGEITSILGATGGI